MTALNDHASHCHMLRNNIVAIRDIIQRIVKHRMEITFLEGQLIERCGRLDAVLDIKFEEINKLKHQLEEGENT